MFYFTVTSERHFFYFGIICINIGGEALRSAASIYIILCRFAYSLMLGSSNP